MTEPNGVAPSPAPVATAPAATLAAAPADTSAKTSNPAPAANASGAKPAAAAGGETTDPTTDLNASLRPRDSRTIHLMLANQGVTSYQERVPLALMDAAYRYTHSILQDALLYSDINSNASNPNNTHASNISLADLRMAITARVNHQFVQAPPKEFLLDLAQERNKVALPIVKREWGIRLPPEQYCLTGVNWDLVLREEDDEGDEEDEDGDGEGGGAESADKMVDEADEEMPDAIVDIFGGGDKDDAAGEDRDMSG